MLRAYHLNRRLGKRRIFVIQRSGKSGYCRQQISGLSIVAESFTHVDKVIDVAGREHKAAAKLKWIFAQAMLAHANCFRPLASAGVVSAEKVKQVGFIEAHGLICLALVVNQKRKGDASLLAEVAGITHIAQSHGGQASTFLAKLLFELAQLRDVLTAEDSAVMTKKNDDGRRITP